MSLKLPLAVVLFGLPLSRVSNPVLAAPVRSKRLSISVLISSNGEGVALEPRIEKGLGSKLSRSLRLLYSSLSKVMHSSVRFHLSVTSEVEGVTPYALYAAASVAMVYSHGRFEGFTPSIGEAASLARSLDELALEDSAVRSYVAAIRYCMLSGKVTVYREGERPFYEGDALNLRLRGGVAQIGAANDPTMTWASELRVLVVKLAGVIPLVAFQRIRDLRALRELFRAENSLYYMVYGLKPPEREGCKWIPAGHGSVAEVCLDGA